MVVILQVLVRHQLAAEGVVFKLLEIQEDLGAAQEVVPALNLSHPVLRVKEIPVRHLVEILAEAGVAQVLPVARRQPQQVELAAQDQIGNRWELFTQAVAEVELVLLELGVRVVMVVEETEEEVLLRRQVPEQRTEVEVAAGPAQQETMVQVGGQV
jgi:hypothetical protein